MRLEFARGQLRLQVRVYDLLESPASQRRNACLENPQNFDCPRLAYMTDVMDAPGYGVVAPDLRCYSSNPNQERPS